MLLTTHWSLKYLIRQNAIDVITYRIDDTLAGEEKVKIPNLLFGLGASACL